MGEFSMEYFFFFFFLTTFLKTAAIHEAQQNAEPTAVLKQKRNIKY